MVLQFIAPRLRSRPAVPVAAAITALLVAAAAALLFARPAGATARPTGDAAPVGLAADAAQATQQGLTPQQIHSAYALPLRGARSQTIAVVSAYDDPYIESDLSAYDKRFRLPACTEKSGCLRRLNQSGKASPLPVKDVTGGIWITESSLGTEVAHAVCESCKLMLVEATTDLKFDFAAAVNAAANAGATVIVTAFTPPEDIGDGQYLLDFSHRHAAVVSASGDPIGGPWGYTGSPDFPSSLPNVIAVGGTSLRVAKNGGYGGERAWEGAVSGCSLYQPAPLWQARIAHASACGSQRAVADISAAADPGAIVHITGSGQPGGPWYVAQGTSFAAPIIAGVIGLAGSMGSGEAQMLYARELTDPGAFHDVRMGANSATCKGAPICAAGRGWDGPTGLGTPNGLAAFLPSGGALDPRHARLTLASRSLRIGSNWQLRLGLDNGNPFAISGSLVLRRALRGHGALRTVVLASRSFTRGPLASGPALLTVAPRYRALVKRLGQLTASARVRIRGPVGRELTVTKPVLLSAP